MIFLDSRESFLKALLLIYRWLGGFYSRLRQLSLVGLMIGHLV